MSTGSDGGDATGRCCVCGAPADAGLFLTVGHMLVCRAPLCDQHVTAVRDGRWGVSVQIGGLAAAGLWCGQREHECVTPLSKGAVGGPQGDQEQHDG